MQCLLTNRRTKRWDKSVKGKDGVFDGKNGYPLERKKNPTGGDIWYVYLSYDLFFYVYTSTIILKITYTERSFAVLYHVYTPHA